MYHQYRKDSSRVRQAIFKVYDGKCQYCGIQMQIRHMHIDHIVPQNANQTREKDVIQYLSELTDNGFILDSIENYLPVCSACNRKKSNTLFSASNLRYYHEVAKKHTQDILSYIEKDTTDEQFFEPVNPDVWEQVTFANQHDISYAIMGYRLGPSDVKVCPRTPQVRDIIRQLSIVDYVVVQGESGCGKSISAYQAAYDYYLNGWIIYRYKDTNSIIESKLPENTEKSLYIIDDAQKLSSSVIYELTEQAHDNRKIIIAKTISDIFSFDTILITNTDAVKILYKTYLSRKNEILPIVQKCDKSVGVDFFTTPFDMRLNNAKEASTPWQFNYILRGGWNTMRGLYLTSCPRKSQRLLVAFIATFQILSLDNSVDYNWLCFYITSLDPSISWGREDLIHLVDKKIIISEDNPRIIHIESAKVVLAQFLEDSDINERSILCSAIEQAVLDKKVSPLGLVWLYNGLLPYIYFERYEKQLITEKMISLICDDLNSKTGSRERMELAYFLDMIFTNGYEKNGFWYFKINLQLLSIWVSETDGDTAYAYSRLVNSLYNKDKALHHQFSQMICWSKLLSAIIEDNGQHLYSWGQLINRLTVSYSKDERETLSSQLDPAIQKLLPSVNTRNIDGMSSFLSDVATLIPHQVSVVIEALLPQYEQYFKEDSSKALHILDFNFLLYVCGLSLLGGHRATEDEKTASSLLVSAVPEREFGNVITNCEPRLWNQFYNVMILISKYDSEKARKIVEYINFETLSKRAEDYWNRERSDIFPLCFGLYLGSRKKAEQFISKNKALIHRFLICYTCVAPACSIQAFRDGIPVDIIGGYSWRLTYFTFKELLLHDEQTANEILHTNIMKIADKINRLSEIDFDDVFCLKFLRLIQSKNHSAYVDVLAGLDATVISKKWPKSFYPQRTKRDKTERYRSFLNHLCDNVTSVDVKNELIEIKKCLSTNKSNNIENHPVDTEP